MLAMVPRMAVVVLNSPQPPPAELGVILVVVAFVGVTENY